MVIDMLGLDRRLLNEARGGLIVFLESIAVQMHAAMLLDNEDVKQRTSAKIRRQTARDQEFAGFRRSYFSQVGLGEYVSGE